MKKIEGVTVLSYGTLWRAKELGASPIVLFAVTIAHIAALCGWLLMISSVAEDSGVLVSNIHSLCRLSLQWVNSSGLEWGAITCEAVGVSGLWLLIYKNGHARQIIVFSVMTSIVVFIINIGAHWTLAHNSPLTFQGLAGVTQVFYVLGLDVIVESIMKTLPAWVIGGYLLLTTGKKVVKSKSRVSG